MEESCSSFKFSRNNHLQATCGGKVYEKNFDDCLGFVDKALQYQKNGLMNDDCSKYKIKADTKENGTKRYKFEAMCYFIPEDEDLDEEEIMTVIYLNDFLSFNGKDLLCKDNISERILNAFVPSQSNMDEVCKNLHINTKNQLNGNCSGINSTAGINQCIGNNNSFFSKGNLFMKSCSICDIRRNTNNTNVLQCTCKDAKNRTRRTIAPLNEFMMYVGEKLQCQDDKVIEEIARKKREKADKKEAEKKRKEAAEKKKKEDAEKKRKEAADKKKAEEAEKKAKKAAADKKKKEAEKKKAEKAAADKFKEEFE